MIEKTLKQDEIDALFEAARSTTPEAARPEVRARVVPYNFSSAGQISTDQLRAISMLNDLFARNLTHNLAAWLRTRFQVNLVSAEQIQFNEFLLRIPEISYVASVRLEPLGALSVLALLGLLLVQAGAGLISDDEVLVSGPLVAKVPNAWVTAATTFHTTVGKFGVLALVALHIGAIVWYRLRKNDDLVTPMWTGYKDVLEPVAASFDSAARRWTALAIAGMCGLGVWALLAWAATAP